MADFLALSSQLADIDSGSAPRMQRAAVRFDMPSVQAHPDPFSDIVMFSFALWQNAPYFFFLFF